MRNVTFDRLKILALLYVLSLLGALLIGTRPAHAATFTVNSTGDRSDADLTNGICNTGVFIFPTGESQCTLRAAVQQANATSGADTINFSVGQVTLSVSGRSEDLAATGDLDVRQDVTIDGGGVTVTAADGFNDRIFHVASPVNATAQTKAIFKDLSVERGEESDGGGIYVNSFARLDLIDGTVRNNLAIDPAAAGQILGGGIYNEGTLTITRSTVSGNTSEASGGGQSFGAGLFSSGPATVTDSTFSGNQAVSTNSNSAASYGGGIYNESDLTLTNVTASGNGAFGAISEGGGLFNIGDLTLTSATVGGNSAAFAANLFNYVGFSTFPYVSPFFVRNTIVANPQGGGANCTGSSNGSLGNNLSSDGSCNFAAAGDIQNQDPKLGTLRNNGGPTQTHALLSRSPAIDAGANTGCPGTDQRGTTRPQDGDKDGSAVCDIGAFEVDPPPDTIIVSGPSGTINSALAAFEFMSTESGSTFQCALDGQVFGRLSPCSSPKGYSNLGDGSHTFRVRAVDAAGNVDPTPAVRTWTVDTTGPSISALRPTPDSRILDRTPLIGAAVADEQADLASTDMTLYVDGQSESAFSYDPSTDRLTYASGRLSYGTHTLRITARDEAGNRSARTWSFKVVR